MITDIQIAQAVAEGVLPSPTTWKNSVYVALRLSGTGVAYRKSLGEFAYRDPEQWLAPEMRRRMLGVPALMEHPEGGVLTSNSFGQSVVGIIVFSFVNTEERSLWGVARILDAGAAAMLAEDVFDTSPAVILPSGSSARIDVNGTPMIVEACPELIDHIALVYTGDGNKGVWTRQDIPGVSIDPQAIEGI